MPALRFYTAKLDEGIVQLDEVESHHAARVMRVRVGDTVDLFDGAGVCARGTISRMGRTVELRVIEQNVCSRPRPRIELAVAMPKGDRAAMLVEKASELGADRVIPLLTKRSLVEPRGKLERLRRVALESAKQCGRAWIMQVDEPMGFKELVNATEYNLKLIADVSRSESATLLDVTALIHDADSVIVAVGPEGGWTAAERDAAAEAGFNSWKLGPHVLRIETAALAALAILRQGA